MARNVVDHSLVDVGPVASLDIEHFTVVNGEHGVEKTENIDFIKLKHELKQDFAGSTGRSSTSSTT